MQDETSPLLGSDHLSSDISVAYVNVEHDHDTRQSESNTNIGATQSKPGAVSYLSFVSY